MICPSCGHDNNTIATFCQNCAAELDPRNAGAYDSEFLLSADFVGRRRELSELVSALNDALAGNRRLAMLAGEPGIGKTRTAQEISSYAEHKGFCVLWGRCYEGQGAPSYWPWVQLIRSYIESNLPETLMSVMNSGASDIAQIVPELNNVLPDLEHAPNLTAEQSQFRLFNSVSAFLKNASQLQPLIIVLDDLHWADRSSLLMMEFIAQELTNSRIMLVGTYRDVDIGRRHPLTQTLGSLVRASGFVRIQFRGLTEPEVAELMRATSGTNAAPNFVDAVYGRTEGNPLFVKELIRGFDHLKHIEGEISYLSIPEGIKDAIGRRLNALSIECNEALTKAAVMGREFDYKLLSLIMDVSNDDDLLDAMEEACEAGVIEELPQQVGRYQFGHALIQETLLEEISLTRKARLHAQIGEALEGMCGENPEPYAAELAFHFREAETVAGAKRLVRYSQMAGEQALAVYSHEEALKYFERALTALDNRPIDAVKAALLSGLARAQAATFERHRIGEVMATLGLALDYFAEAGDLERVVSIAEYPFYPMLGQSTGNANLIAIALAMVPPESEEAGRLLSRYGRVLGTEEGDHSNAVKALSEALAIAERYKNPTLEMQALAEAANVDMLYQRFQECIDKNNRVAVLSLSIDEPQTEVVSRYSAFLSNIALGQLREAGLQIPHIIARADKLRDRFWSTVALRSQEDVAHLKGDWETARKLSDQGLSLSPSECRNLITRTLIEYQTGNYGAGREFLQRLIEVAQRTPSSPNIERAYAVSAIYIAARISGERDIIGAGQAIADTVLLLSPRVGYVDWSVRNALGLMPHMLADKDRANEQYDALLRHRGTMLLFGMTATDRTLGLISQTMGNMDRAVSHFADAMHFCREAEYNPELAWVCYDYANALIQRNYPNDLAKASGLLEESLSISKALGMLPLENYASQLLTELESSPRRRSYPAGLSEREVEVLCLIALGKSNREIGDQLFISANTVANHVRSILTKTDTSNRAEAAAFAISQKLLDS